MLSSSLTLDSVVRQSPDILSAGIGDEIVLASVAVGVFCGMDEVGADLWRRIAEPCKVADLAASLAEAYDGPKEDIAADVVATLKRLFDEGFVIVVD